MANETQVPRLSAQQIAQLEPQIRQAVATGNRQQEILLTPPGYRFENGRLKYVALAPEGNWFDRNILSKPEVMIPLIVGGGLGLGALTGPATAGTEAGGSTGTALTETLPFHPEVAGLGTSTAESLPAAAATVAPKVAGAVATGTKAGQAASGFNLTNLLKKGLPALGASLAGRAIAGDGSSGTSGNPANGADFQQLLHMGIQRSQDQEALRTAVNKLALSLLPRTARG